MKTVILSAILLFSQVHPLTANNLQSKTSYGVVESTPPISLFESIERVKSFLKTEAKSDYSDKYLSSITLHFFDSHPKKGLAWVYSFSFKKPRFGGDISVYHFMDGELIEFNHGP